MGYTVKYHGYEVICDTATDLRALIGQNGDAPPPVQQHLGGSQIPLSKPTLAALVARLPNAQVKLLRIVSAAGPIDRESLQGQMGISDTHQFAGLLIALTKFAAGAGMDSPIEKTVARLNGSGPRVYQYSINDSVKAELKEALARV